jgi:hypothetical protein
LIPGCHSVRPPTWDSLRGARKVVVGKVVHPRQG